MTTETMTLAAYARTHDTSRQAAAKWQSRGYLVMLDGLVDVAASDAKMEAGAKGRFRVKAHGGRREAGVRGVIDRPGLGISAGGRKGPPNPWVGWHRVDNPVALSANVRAMIEAGDQESIDDALDALDHSEWENACTALGWDRWPEAAAAAIAEDLGLVGREEALREALHQQVRARLASLDIEERDLADTRLKPR
jgi:hypothetical protein